MGHLQRRPRFLGYFRTGQMARPVRSGLQYTRCRLFAPNQDQIGAHVRAYIVVQITIDDPETYERYKALAPPSIAAYGGTYLVRGAKTTTLEGSWDPERFVILEFPS